MYLLENITVIAASSPPNDGNYMPSHIRLGACPRGADKVGYFLTAYSRFRCKDFPPQVEP